MISVEEARSRILEQVNVTATETINIAAAHNRALAENVIARVTQPPKDVSAMDGYAVRSADLEKIPATLKVIGESAAGKGYYGSTGAGQAVRIFTGAPLPAGADTIVIQENTERDGELVKVLEGTASGTYVRPAGLDFRVGDIGLQAGRLLTARDIGLAAAMNVPWLTVRRRPRIALLATGDEIVRPGDPLAANQIVSSNSLALAGLIQASGGEAVDLGIAADDEASLRQMAAGARGADMLITMGGASVGEHDLIRSVLGDEGLEIDFWRIAMRPGKPLIWGRIGDIPMLGLPGNPVSSLVCGLIYLRPAITRMLGLAVDPGSEYVPARLGCDLSANDQRQDYLRATLDIGNDGEMVATPFGKQDSSMLSRLAKSDCLILRLPHAPPAKAGDNVSIIQLSQIGGI
jgi:molybdopterin molybdotransferase